MFAKFAYALTVEKGHAMIRKKEVRRQTVSPIYLRTRVVAVAGEQGGYFCLCKMR